MLLLMSMAQFTSAQTLNKGKQIIDRTEQEVQMELLSSSDAEMVVKLKLNAFDVNTISTPQGEAVSIAADNCGWILEKGSPQLPRLATSLMVPAGDLSLEVIDTKYISYENVLVAPSKGNITRDINPDDVPFTYSNTYEKDAFYPESLAHLSEDYLISDQRGVAVQFYPFAYNPVSKQLNVYTELTVKVSVRNAVAINSTRTTKARKQVFAQHFLNYAPERYTQLDDAPGSMLVISYGSFMDEMQDFVDWKNAKGIPTVMVNVADIGNASAIKTYVQNYYNNNNDFTYLLLVGDHTEVPVSSTSAGPSDQNYGYTSGTDHYADIFVGRFSATSASHVTSQVNKTIYYEKDVAASATWMTNAIGSASNEGSSSTGDDGESDAQHMNNIENDLEGYGYDVTRVYQSGGSVAAMSNAINAGTGLINYVGHGSETSWVNVSFGTSSINGLTNVNKYPFIMDVACVNGKFTRSGDCFAEAWMKATHNGQPSGAIAICASTINQSWAPPMRAQDEFNDILTGNINGNVKHTYGGLVMNGIFDMIDNYGSGGDNMADTWTIFGDPSLMVRTKQASNMTVTTPSIAGGASSVAVSCNTNGALIAISKNGTLYGRATVNSGTANITLTNLPSSGTVTLTATAHNKVTVQQQITLGGSTPQPPVAEFSANPTTVNTGGSVQFTDASTNNPTSWNWTFAGGNPATSTAQNPSVTYATAGTYQVSLEVSNAEGNDTEVKTAYITVEDVVASYCSASGNNSSYEWIKEVQLNDFSKTSGAAGYTDFTSTIIEVTEGSNCALTLKPGFKSTTYMEYWKVYIDYNNDKDFEDAGEEVFADNSKSDVTGNFTLPANLTGDYRMRVVMKYNAAPEPCGSFSYGEVEDYTIRITEEVPVVDYCTAGGNSNSYEWIAKVQVGSFTKTSNGASYSDFTSSVINVQEGSNTITLTPGFSGSSYTEKWKVYIDLNADGDFEDANEAVYSNSGSSAVSGTFTIPDGTVTSTRMRVVMSFSTISSPCGSFSYGEVEDYSLAIQRAGRGFNSFADHIQMYPNPCDDKVMIETAQSIEQLNVYSISGELITTHQPMNRSFELDMTSLESGTYIIKVKTNESNTVHKLVKM